MMRKDYKKKWNKENRKANIDKLNQQCKEYKRKNKIKLRNQRRKLIKTKKQKLVDYKGGKCSVCGFDKHLSALDFHHINPNNKEFEIGHNLGYTLDRLKKETDKCILICANCHRELHSLY